MPQFIIQFHTLHTQLTQAPPEDEAKAVFLVALREPLRTMCGLLDFRTSTVDQVIDRVLEMDKNSSFMSLPGTSEGRRFEVLAGPAVHDVPQFGPLNGRLHSAHTVYDLQLSGTYNGPLRVQLA